MTGVEVDGSSGGVLSLSSDRAEMAKDALALTLLTSVPLDTNMYKSEGHSKCIASPPQIMPRPPVGHALCGLDQVCEGLARRAPRGCHVGSKA